MGIKHFFRWFKDHFCNHIIQLRKNCNLDIKIDNFLIDMNGLFHDSTQKIYQYGNYKPLPRLLGPPQKEENIIKNIEVFKDICNNISKLIKIVKPLKRLILCVDGPAPIAKQCQQRARRFTNSTNTCFDSNSLTPGTEFMDNLTKYINNYIKNVLILKYDIEIIFSNEKVPGEGEHKLLNFIRKFGINDESYCIHGMDADLIMLALGTHLDNIYIFREDMITEYDYYCINIGSIRKELSDMMKWKETNFKYHPNLAISDFIFMCFAVGNDFLPHIPGIEIAEGGIEFMLDIYKNIGEYFGHITCIHQDKIRFRRTSLAPFLGMIGQYEYKVFEQKISHKDFFEDPILLNSNPFNIEQYRKDYYKIKLNDCNLKTLCHSYLEGMQWVLSYYINGISNWKWRFPYHYAPFSFTLSKYVKSFIFEEYPISYPTTPFVQLLSVLPSKSADLLPKPLNEMLKPGGLLYKNCPTDFKIDLEGKRNTWEGVVLLPMVNYDEIEAIKIEPNKNNIIGKTFIYKKDYSGFIDF